MTQPQAQQGNKLTPLQEAVKIVQAQTNNNLTTEALETIAQYLVYSKPNKNNSTKVLYSIKAIEILHAYFQHLTPELNTIRKTVMTDMFTLLDKDEIDSFNDVL